MKKYFRDFLHRGFLAMGGGPIVMAIVYFIRGKTGVVDSLSTDTVLFGVLTVSLLTFIAAGITVVYQIERLPIFSAMLIHGVVLYLDYLIIYLVNGWLKNDILPFIIFTIWFVLGYLVIWLIIYLITRAYAKKLTDGIKADK
ncbi:MAG: DUF3021 domain-containing protein [Clostridia bacterium]|nr:DUF3021 domain-containing protein [Clostridia bacterium]